MKLSCTVNTKDLHADLERTLVRVRRERRSILKEEAKEIFEESQIQVPKDTTALAQSGKVEELQDGSYIVSYGKSGVNPKTGKPVEDYAVEVHEDLSMNHPRGGKAKFLEDPVKAHEEAYAEKMAKKLRSRVFKGG